MSSRHTFDSDSVENIMLMHISPTRGSQNYWLCIFYIVHLLYIYKMLRFVGTLINTHDDDDENETQWTKSIEYNLRKI